MLEYNKMGRVIKLQYLLAELPAEILHTSSFTHFAKFSYCPLIHLCGQSMWSMCSINSLWKMWWILTFTQIRCQV